MDWSRGFTARYYAVLLDTDTWRELGQFDITGGSIKKNDSDLRESASIDCDLFDRDRERWVRIYMDARQDGESGAHEALFTGLATAPKVSIEGRFRSHSVECYSVLKPAQDILLPLGYNVLAGSNGAEEVKKLLSVVPANIDIEGSAIALRQDIVAEGGETNLSMADKILEAMNWRLRILGTGDITICPKADATQNLNIVSFNEEGNDVLEISVTVEKDWFNCPNVFRAYNDEYTAIARDDDPYSQYSTVSRGREIWMEESSVQLTAKETMAEYAKRRLTEEQQISYKVNYDRRFDPSVVTTDLIEIHYPSQEISDYFVVKSQSIELGYGGRTSEEVELWVAS